MKILDIQQNTKEWEELRRTKIGASDCPIIMGKSPFKTPYQLWEQKVQGKAGFVSKAMERGTSLEDTARAFYEGIAGCCYPPIVVQSNELEFMIASLDGYNELVNEIIEIKCPGEKVFNEINKNKEIPEYYRWQAQHQMAVTGAEKISFLVYSEEGHILLTVCRNLEMIAQLLDAEKEFFRKMVEFDPPSSSDADLIERNDEEWKEAAHAWIVAKNALKEAEELESICREGLVHLAGDQSCKGGGISVSRYVRRGTVDYAKIPQLKGVDLEVYRKPNSVSWRFNGP
jgi:putative phage-type endonuclease